MIAAIKENIRHHSKINTGTVNYIQPCKNIGKNILSHKISLDTAKTFAQLVDGKPYYYQTTRYFNNDTIMEVDKKGYCTCYMEPTKYMYYSDKYGLRYIKAVCIPISVSRFNINSINHKHQTITAIYETCDAKLEMEFLMNSIKKKRTAKKTIESILSGSISLEEADIKSISYKLYITHICDIERYIRLLKNF